MEENLYHSLKWHTSKHPATTVSGDREQSPRSQPYKAQLFLWVLGGV